VFDQFTDLVVDAGAWAYVVILVVALLDAILPVVPSETVVITAGVLAASHDLWLPFVLVCAALGAFTGDTTVYLIGRRYGEGVRRRLLRGERGKRAVAWASGLLETRGGELIVVGRFIPGGRTAVTLTAGMTHFPWRRFARAAVIAAVLWASYAGMLGYFGGKAFEDAPWTGLLLAFGIALFVSAATEAIRAIRRRRRS
jgi:membrane protein DedA with SNARE-associated domain